MLSSWAQLSTSFYLLLQACSSWKCDMWAELAPLRHVRPMCGGPGYDWQLVMQLRQLYFDLG